MVALTQAATSEAREPGYTPQVAAKPVEPADYLFTYGSLMRGQPRHGVLAREEFYGEGSISGRLFDTNCGFPAIFLQGNDLVWGEVYRVLHPELWGTLDSIENYLYHRVARRVRVPHRGVFVTAQLYVANPEVWTPDRLKRIPDGRWENYAL